MRARVSWAVLSFALAIPAAALAQAPEGSQVFDNNCATCHAANDPRTPSVAQLRERTPEAILSALTTGVMRQQGSELTDAQRRSVAAFLGGRPVGSETVSSGGRCTQTPAFDQAQGTSWPGWSPGLANARFQATPGGSLTADSIPRLKLKWAFGFPNATSARAQPTIAGGRVFVGSQDGTVYSLDAKTGCTIWTFKAAGAVRTAIVIGPQTGSRTLAYFAGRANVYAVNAQTGEQIWMRSVDPHPSAGVTGSPTIYQNRLYVPVASGEEGQGGNERYECCTFRGSIVALDLYSGNVVWKTFTIPQEPRTIGRNKSGTVRWGPAGAGIWSSPTIDPKRRVLYTASGNQYTEPQTESSDAIFAMDLDTGKLAWQAQVLAKDVFVVGCNQPNTPNCPPGSELGPDFDFGQSPMLTTLPDGRDLIVIGQKSGQGWALDPDKKGAVVWRYDAGKGTALGGMEFGSTNDGENAYFALNDGNFPSAGEMHAVKLSTGERAWKTSPPELACGERGRGCTPGLLAAITSMPGAVFAGSMDGGIRAYSTKDGSIIWQFNSNTEFTTVNGVPAKGASISGPGPAIADGMLYVNSGYGALGGRPGNVLLAFGVE